MKFNELIAQKFPQLKNQALQSNKEEELLTALYIYRKEFGLTYEELMNEPWPVFLEFCRQISNAHEREKKEANKPRRGK